MAKYRHNLPQVGDRVFLTDSGLETTLIFQDGIQLNQFASFELIKTEHGRQRLHDYFRQHARTAVDARMGFVLESATWRSNSDWGAKLGYSQDELDALNRASIELLVQVRNELETDDSPMPISGNIGPLGDGYVAGTMGEAEAQALHAPQIRTFADSEADLVSAITMNYIDEAIGIGESFVSSSSRTCTSRSIDCRFSASSCPGV